MSPKVTIFLSVLAVASAGIIGTDYSPATSVSYSSISTPTIKTIESPKLEKVISSPLVYSKAYTPAPYYESVLSTEQRKLQNSDGSEQTIYSKSLNTAYADIKKYESRTTDGNRYGHHFPIYSTGIHENPYVYHPTYNFAAPVVHTVTNPALSKSISVPIYTTHSIPVTKTKTTKVISTPLYTKTKIITSGIPTYSSHTPVLVSPPVKTAITYSDAPLVSHMTFSGLGASYGW
ncbi:hypothetical protein O3G_MSEX005148 [Manduca sexta]|uniref:Cuticle protein n=1 Tax=Manduca sexta TaxID=7130 RepID=A0A922CJD3_MANSE|nr:hypothetical protein O3G_MSEX005148 [Manduca sexta]KAG6447753.1 hypothetical protein O3G_MSEX005148 [Manduca sexta]